LAGFPRIRDFPEGEDPRFDGHGKVLDRIGAERMKRIEEVLFATWGKVELVQKKSR
jgi:hypothetical protein